MRPVRYAARAQRDLLQALEFLHAENPAAAARFADRLDRAVLLLQAFPRAGKELDETRRRALPIVGTGHHIAYVLQGEDILVLRIWHGARGWPPAD